MRCATVARGQGDRRCVVCGGLRAKTVSSGNRVRRVVGKSCGVTGHVGLITCAWGVDGKTTTLVFPLRTVPFVVLAGRVLWSRVSGEGDCGRCKGCSGEVVVSKGSAAWKTWRADDDDATFGATKMSLEAKVRETCSVQMRCGRCVVFYTRNTF